jgi:hypothetical protein
VGLDPTGLPRGPPGLIAEPLRRPCIEVALTVIADHHVKELLELFKKSSKTEYT